MFNLPHLPTWDNVHPIVVHFPLGLLLTAPAFLLLAMVSKKHGRALSVGALLLLALGTLGAYLAVLSGEAGEEAAERVAGVRSLVHDHEEMAESAMLIFVGLTLVYAALAAAPIVVRRLSDRRPLLLAAHAVFFVAYAICTLPLVNAAQLGGRLVHERGVHANLGSPAAPADVTAPVEQDD